MLFWKCACSTRDWGKRFYDLRTRISRYTFRDLPLEFVIHSHTHLVSLVYNSWVKQKTTTAFRRMYGIRWSIDRNTQSALVHNLCASKKYCPFKTVLWENVISRQLKLRAQWKMRLSASTQLYMWFCRRLVIWSAKIEFSLSTSLIGLWDNSEHSYHLLK